MSDSKSDKTPTTGKEILALLQTTVKGLLFPSESDKPLKAFLWQSPENAKNSPADNVDITSDTLKSSPQVPANATIETVTVKEFFAPVVAVQDWFGDDEKATAARFQALSDTLEKSLTKLSVFRVTGDSADTSKVTVYVVGRTPDGDLAGVSTQLIET